MKILSKTLLATFLTLPFSAAAEVNVSDFEQKKRENPQTIMSCNNEEGTRYAGVRIYEGDERLDDPEEGRAREVIFFDNKQGIKAEVLGNLSLIGSQDASVDFCNGENEINVSLITDGDPDNVFGINYIQQVPGGSGTLAALFESAKGYKFYMPGNRLPESENFVTTEAFLKKLSDETRGATITVAFLEKEKMPSEYLPQFIFSPVEK